MTRITAAPAGQQVALIAGASRGIGAAVARRLLDRGWRVLSVSRTQPAEDHEWCAADLATQDGIAKAQDFVQQTTERLDALVVCAGKLFVDKTLRINGARALEALAVNVGPVVGLGSMAARMMGAQRYGRIVAVGSVGAYRVSPGNGRYAASKAALEGLVRSAARELAPLGVTVNLVAPGFTDTAMVAKGTDEWRESRRTEIPRGRWADPDDIAAPLVELLDPRAGYINGATLMIDGGYAMGR